MKKNIALLLLLCLAGCSQKHIKQKSKRTFSQVNHILQDTYHTTIAWDQAILKDETQTLSLKDAITTAMHNNPQLQADLEILGIANADLVQAGLYTNPFISSVFRLPKKCDETTNIETDFIWNFSDLWQVPLRKNVARDEFEIT